MKNYQIAVVPGDGIGHEIVPAGLKVLQAAAEKHHFTLETDQFPWGAGYYKQHGKFMPDDGLETLRQFDAIYFGAVGDPEVDDTLPAMLYTFRVRTAFQQYVNYRPVKLLPGIESPLRYKSHDDIDFVVIRENNEGEFVQNGKIIHPDQPYGLATDTSVFTRAGIRAHCALFLSVGAEEEKEGDERHEVEYADPQPGLLGSGDSGSGRAVPRRSLPQNVCRQCFGQLCAQAGGLRRDRDDQYDRRHPE